MAGNGGCWDRTGDAVAGCPTATADRLRPAKEDVKPLPELTQAWWSVGRKATEALANATARWVPGATRVPPPTPTSATTTAATAASTTTSNPDEKLEEGRTPTPTPTPPRPTRNPLPAQIISSLVVFALFLVALAYDGYASSVASFGVAQTFGCTDTLWGGVGLGGAIQCGVNGVECRPFSMPPDAWFGARCQAQCVWDKSRYAGKSVRGGGDPADQTYTADSHICASAVHAGVIDDAQGGCFEIRFVGPRANFTGSTKHDVSSQDFGWFPRGVQFRRTPSATAYCGRTRWATNLAAVLGSFYLLVIVRIQPEIAILFLGQIALFYLGLYPAPPGTAFFYAVNAVSVPEYVLLPMTYTLWRLLGAPHLLPDPRRAPFEVFCLWFTPFWAAINLDDFQRLGIDFTFSSKGASPKAANVAVYVIIALVAVPVFVVQARLYYRAGLVPVTLGLGLGVVGLYLLILGLGGAAYLSFHFHHYFFGLIIVLLCRGHTVHGLVLTAVGFGLFVNGLVLFNTDPMYDETMPLTGYVTAPFGVEPSDAPLWTNVEILPTPVTSPWTNTLTTALDVKFVMPLELYARNATCDASVAAVAPSLAGYYTLVQQGEYFVAPASGAGTTTISSGPSVPGDAGAFETDTAAYRFVVARNGVVAGLGYVGGHVTQPGFDVETSLAPVVYVAAPYLGSGGSYTSPSASLPVPFPSGVDWASVLGANATAALTRDMSTGLAQYGGYYNATEALDTCARIKAIYTRLRLLQKFTATATPKQVREAGLWWAVADSW